MASKPKYSVSAHVEESVERKLEELTQLPKYSEMKIGQRTAVLVDAIESYHSLLLDNLASGSVSA